MDPIVPMRSIPILLALASAATAAPPTQRLEYEHLQMGTWARIVLWTDDAALGDPAAAAAFADDSHSWFAAAPTPGRVDWAPIPPGDLNGDGRVGGFDLDLIRAYWNQTVSRGNKSKGDLNGDGTVDSADLALLRTLWGTR